MIRSRSYDAKQQEIKDFWENNKADFPFLFKLAKVVFAISPISSQAERNFSTSNVVLSQRRASLHPERMHRILFLHDNLQFLLSILNNQEV